MPIPSHINPSPNRTACAPYNFVPLPERIVKAVEHAEDLPDQDRFYNEPERYSGKIKVTLETSSPLYIRAPLTREQFQYQQEGKYVDGGEIDNPKKPVFRRLVKNLPEFFYTDRKTRMPVIPGSSLRGMLRSLLEIVSFGKIQWVTDNKLFYRAVNASDYNKQFVAQMGKTKIPPNPEALAFGSRVEGGFLRKGPNGSFYIEKGIITRIDVSNVLRVFNLQYESDLYELNGRNLTAETRDNPNQTPKWKFQHEKLWVEMDAAEQFRFFPKKFRRNGKLRHPDLYLKYRRASNPELNSNKTEPPTQKLPGTLVLTGRMQNKHLVFVFVPEEKPETITIPPKPDDKDQNLTDLFHSDEQITPWQESAFPSGKSKFGARQSDGHLADGEPVFFLRERGRLKFIGRAQLFRLPYDNSPLDLVPEEYRRPEDIDFAEALFGFVRTDEEIKNMKARAQQVPQPGEKGYAYAGRVFVTDAIIDDAASVEQVTDDEGKAIVPPILATPKPTSYQHYLMQPNQDDSNKPRQLYHYSDVGKTVIRGFKRYWFKRERGPEDLRVKHPDESNWVDQNAKDLFENEKINDRYVVKERNSQLTQFMPIKTKSGKHFTFYIHFENLREDELGALLWTLELPGPKKGHYRHSLGMGKPLGMGAVKLTPTLFLTNRRDRYQHLFKDDNWDAGSSTPQDTKRFIEKFEHFVLNAVARDKQKLHEVKRIEMLLNMLEWPGPEPEHTRYLLIKRKDGVNEYSTRPVLPDPEAFGGLLGAKAVSTIADKSEAGSDAASQFVASKPPQNNPQQQPSTPETSKRKTYPPPPAQPSIDMSKDAQALLKSIEKQQRIAEAQAQSVYKNNEVEKKATVVKKDDGSLCVVLPKLKDLTFPLKRKPAYSQAAVGAKLRVRVMLGKNNAITQVEEI